MNLKNLTLLEIPSRHRNTTHPRINLEVSVQKDFKSQKVKSKDTTSVRLRIECPDKGAMDHCQWFPDTYRVLLVDRNF